MTRRAWFRRGRIAAMPVLGPAMAACAAVTSCDRSTGPKGPRELPARWYAAQSGYSASSPAVAGQVAYFGTGDGRVVARERAGGGVRWATPISGGSVDGANLLVRAGVVVAVATYETVGLDAGTGGQLWRFSAPPDPAGGPSPTIGGLVQGARLDADDATVFVPAWGASVSAVDLATGQARWVWTPGRAATDTSASALFRSGAEGVRVSGDTVFAGVWHNLDDLGTHGEAWLVALDRATGAELWRVTVPVSAGAVTVDGAPGLAGNLAFLGTQSGNVWAVDRTSRQVVWRFQATPHLATQSQPEAAGGVVYRDGGDELLYALRATDGAVLWKSATGGQIGGDLLVSDRMIYATILERVLVFDRQTGSKVAVLLQPHPPATGGGLIGPVAAGPSRERFTTVSGGAVAFDEP